MRAMNYMVFKASYIKCYTNNVCMEVVMVRKTFKTGNSIVISLRREALEYLGIQEGAEVTVKLGREHGHIVISPIEVPITVAGVDEEFSRQIKLFIEQYRPALEALAN
jgi:hypothetical protein